MAIAESINEDLERNRLLAAGEITSLDEVRVHSFSLAFNCFFSSHRWFFSATSMKCYHVPVQQ